MNKNEINQIHNLNREIKLYMDELESIQCGSLVKGQQLTGMPSAKKITDKVGNLAIEKVDLEAMIREKIAEKQAQKEKIMDFINGIDDSIMRQIIFLRCISCLNWNCVADKVGGNNTEDSVRMRFNRFFK